MICVSSVRGCFTFDNKLGFYSATTTTPPKFSTLQEIRKSPDRSFSPPDLCSVAGPEKTLAVVRENSVGREGGECSCPTFWGPKFPKICNLPVEIISCSPTLSQSSVGIPPSLEPGWKKLLIQSILPASCQCGWCGRQRLCKLGGKLISTLQRRLTCVSPPET